MDTVVMIQVVCNDLIIYCSLIYFYAIKLLIEVRCYCMKNVTLLLRVLIFIKLFMLYDIA